MPVTTLTLLVTLLVSTQSGMTTAGISKLQREVAAIYAGAGVRVEWVDASVQGALTVTIVRTLPPIDACESALGCTVHDPRNKTPPRAYVATEAIRIEEERHTPVRRQLLGFVVGHEIGHLLDLPHTRSRGLMFRNTYWLPDVRWTKEDRLNVQHACDALVVATNSREPVGQQRATDDKRLTDAASGTDLREPVMIHR
jgi:hypothetical protein